ncbi:MAG: DUF1800 domain-containing protein [Cytophagales bacterium]|nr:DUF1800 domain-containing protein [Cytophagales bacterium]
MNKNKDPRKRPSKQTMDHYRKVKPVVLKEEKLPFPQRATLSTGLTPHSGEWSEAQVVHLLKRTLFGAKRAEIDQFLSMTMDEAVEAIVQPSARHTPPVNDYAPDGSEFEDEVIPYGETWIEAPFSSEHEGSRIISLKAWIINNILTQETTIHEKLTLFWHNLLVTQFWDVFIAKTGYEYYQMLYDNAFGNYRDLAEKITLDPAMLIYLNGAFNNKEAPDENYARELQELFCIGKGPNAGFTENDVYEAARVLTGWSVTWEHYESEGDFDSRFHDWDHDTGDKQFSEFYGNRVIEGKSGGEGRNEVFEMLDMIFENEEVSYFICRRLYNFFVYHEIDEATETNVITPMAQIFRDNNYEITPVLIALFKSEHFYDVANYGASIKNPMDLLLGFARVLDNERPQDINELHIANQEFIWTMAQAGLEIGDPPSVSGWQAYYQAPSFDKLWINTETVIRRIQYSQYNMWRSDLTIFINSLHNPSDPNEMIREAALLLLGIELSEEVSNGLKSTLLTGQGSDEYWTFAWDQFINFPDNPDYRTTVQNRLAAMFRSMLEFGEFQLM